MASLVAADRRTGEPARRTEQTELGRKLADLRARLAEDPRVKEAQAAVERAEKTIAEKIGRDPAIIEARKAELAARDAVAKAEQAAADAHPQVQEQRRALAADPRLAAARQTLDEKVATDQEVAAQAAKVKAAAEAQDAHRKSIADLEKKVREATVEVAAKDPRVAEAGKAVVAARERVGKTIEDQTAAERKARDAARSAWREKFDTLIAENPDAKALMVEIQGLEERLQQLRSQMGELRRPVTQANL